MTIEPKQFRRLQRVHALTDGQVAALLIIASGPAVRGPGGWLSPASQQRLCSRSVLTLVRKQLCLLDGPSTVEGTSATVTCVGSLVAGQFGHGKD